MRVVVVTVDPAIFVTVVDSEAVDFVKENTLSGARSRGVITRDDPVSGSCSIITPGDLDLSQEEEEEAASEYDSEGPLLLPLEEAKDDEAAVALLPEFEALDLPSPAPPLVSEDTSASLTEGGRDDQVSNTDLGRDADTANLASFNVTGRDASDKGREI